MIKSLLGERKNLRLPPHCGQDGPSARSCRGTCSVEDVETSRISGLLVGGVKKTKPAGRILGNWKSISTHADPRHIQGPTRTSAGSTFSKGRWRGRMFRRCTRRRLLAEALALGGFFASDLADGVPLDLCRAESRDERKREIHQGAGQRPCAPRSRGFPL